jgi:hypothetical protein
MCFLPLIPISTNEGGVHQFIFDLAGRVGRAASPATS